MYREDYVIRMIKQLGAFLARIAAMRKRGDYAGALETARTAWGELFDVPRDLVEVVDGPTLARLLGEPARMRAAADLLMEEARNYAMQRDLLHATLASKRALELRLEARAIDPQDEDDAVILELGRVIPPNEIDPRYREP